MLDVGLGTGVQALGQQNLLYDYTVIVQARRFPVHKVVMAAVSDYFRALLCNPFVETSMDETEVKGQSADVVEKVLEFVYNGDKDFITQHALDILGCALYLQMPAVIDICIQKLMDNIDNNNWHCLLTTLETYSLIKEAEKVKLFVRENWVSVIKQCNPEELSLCALEVIVQHWKMNEMDLFLFINTWIYVDLQERKEFIDRLMSHVRFSLFQPKDLETIRQTSVFSERVGSWHSLVVKAVEYHQLPIHMKVMDKSEQTKSRTEPSPVFFTSGPLQDRSIFHSLDTKNHWKKHNASYTPHFQRQVERQTCVFRPPNAIEVNNFFVVCSSYDENQEWHILDGQTMTWSQISSMPMPKEGFALTHYDFHLYLAGGQFVNGPKTCEIDRYDFSNNTWSTYSSLPFSLEPVRACVLGDTLYVCGDQKPIKFMGPLSSSLICLSLSSDGLQWENKSPFKGGCCYMSVMKIDNEDVILVFDGDYDTYYYKPIHDQWSRFMQPFRLFYGDWEVDTVFMARGNTIYLLNVWLENDSDDEEDSSEDEDDFAHDNVCLKWEIPINGSYGTVIRLRDFPFESDFHDNQKSPFGALLAIPYSGGS